MSERNALWQEDLDFFATELPKRHGEPFFSCPQATFERDIAALGKAIPQKSDTQLRAGLVRLAALLGDGHTFVTGTDKDFPQLPVSLWQFPDGWYFTAAPLASGLAGKRLIGMNGKPLKEVEQRLRPYISWETDSWGSARLATALITPTYLIDAGISSRERGARFTAEGRECDVTLDQAAELRTSARLAVNAPLTSRRALEPYWFTVLPGSKTLFIQYNQCRSVPEKPFSTFVKEVMAAALFQPIERCVLDLRYNGGGNSAVIWPLTSAIAEAPFGKPGKVFVLVGRRTFSSAFLNATEWRNARFAARWVGEPPGQAARHHGEVKTFSLPHSRLIVQYATKVFAPPGGGRPVDLPIALRFPDYLAGKDAVLEAAERAS